MKARRERIQLLFRNHKRTHELCIYEKIYTNSYKFYWHQNAYMLQNLFLSRCFQKSFRVHLAEFQHVERSAVWKSAQVNQMSALQQICKKRYILMSIQQPERSTRPPQPELYYVRICLFSGSANGSIDRAPENAWRRLSSSWPGTSSNSQNSDDKYIRIK